MPNYTLPDKHCTALLTINAQRDFTLEGSPVRASGVGRAVPAMVALVKAFRQQRAPIVHAVRLYRPDGSNVDAFRREAVEEGMRILMPGTFGAELIDDLKPSLEVRLDPNRLLAGRMQEIGPSECVMYKPRWGAFYGTDLEQHLRQHSITTLVICGCNFTTSCRATVYEAGARDFRIVLVCDAVSGASEESLCELGRIGVYLKTSENCLAWLRCNEHPNAAA